MGNISAGFCNLVSNQLQLQGVLKIKYHTWFTNIFSSLLR